MSEPARRRMTSDEFIVRAMEQPEPNAANSLRAKWSPWRPNGQRTLGSRRASGAGWKMRSRPAICHAKP